MRMWHLPMIAALALALSACVGASHQLPLISQDDVLQASSEIESAPDLHTVRRTSGQNQALVMRATQRLQNATFALCNQVGHSPCSFDVVFDPSDEVNAYASGDDRIVIYDGLVKYLETEDEIAAVIAHEMGHHIAGHIEASQINAGTGAIVSAILYTAVIAAATGGNVDPDVFNSGLDSSAQLGASMGQLSFSKEHEREADYLAAYLLARAGYDLNRARRLWVQLTKSSGNMQTDMFDTHPAGPDRLAAWDLAVAEVAASDDLLPEMK
jgi:Zn-dependent protease with chaperone function